ncbi:MAG: bacterial Ig-like domain-containing protein, partial [Eubacterium sp.]
QFETTYEVNIKAKSVVSIAMDVTPKIDYIEGQTLNVENGTIKVTYDNGTTSIERITEEMCSGFDAGKPLEKQSITVTYQKATTTYDISIQAKQLESIKMDKIPQTEYFVDDPLDISKGTITRVYDNGSTDTLAMSDTEVSVDGFNAKTAKTQMLTVTYKGKTTTFNVTVMTKDRMNAFVQKVKAIDDKSLTLKDKGMVESLKAEYGALSELERNAMPKDTVDHLNRIIDKMNQLIEEENKNKAEGGQIQTITKVTNPNTGLTESSENGLTIAVVLMALIVTGTVVTLKKRSAR